MTTFEWICPYCDVASLINAQESRRWGFVYCDLEGADGTMAVAATFLQCRNPDCRRKTVSAQLLHAAAVQFDDRKRATALHTYRTLVSRRLIPSEGFRAFPECVPQPIRDDYEEAMAIVELSPKAAATLARRALQGMIRDFHGIKKRTLAMEIAALKGKIDPVTSKAIDAVRSVGNIGAHMEKNINVIVDVEPDEAEKLLRLVEMLVDDWYIARQRRQDDLAAVIEVGAAKKAERQAARDAATTPETNPPAPASQEDQTPDADA